MFTPRYYQSETSKAMSEFMYSNNTVAKIELPTGTGKTKTVATFANENPSIKIAFCMPRINLAHQTIEDFPNCGITQGNLYKASRSNVMLFTAQTLVNRLESGHMSINDYDVYFIDECHMSDRESAIILDFIHQFNSNAKIVGISATPYNSKGEYLESFGRGTVELVPKEYRQIQKFVDEGFLCPIDYMQVAVTPLSDEDIKVNQKGDFTKETLEESVRHSIDIIGDLKNRMIGQTLVIASNIEHCDKLVKELLELGISAKSLHSKKELQEYQPIGAKKKLWKKKEKPMETIRQFKNFEFKVLVSVNMVGVGTDVPCISTVVLARMIASVSDFRQFVGRGIRLFEGKDSCLVLDYMGNADRLGHPFTRIEPVEKGEEDIKAVRKCPECGEKSIPTLTDTKIKDFKLYKKFVYSQCCDFEQIKFTELETVTCRCRNVFIAEDIKKKGLEIYATCPKCYHENLTEVLKPVEFERILFSRHQTFRMVVDGFEKHDIMITTQSKHEIKFFCLLATDDDLKTAVNYILDVNVQNEKGEDSAYSKNSKIKVLRKFSQWFKKSKIQSFMFAIKNGVEIDKIEIKDYTVSELEKFCANNKMRDTHRKINKDLKEYFKS